MDIQTLSYVIQQIDLIDKSSITGEELKRYVSNLKNNLEHQIEVQERMINEQFEEWAEEIYYDQLALRDSDGSACLGIQVA